jgi:PhnB protein
LKNKNSEFKAINVAEESLTPYLVVNGGSEAIRFYCDAFEAVEIFRLADSSGKVGHAELSAFGSKFMLADEWPDFGALGPKTLNGTPVSIHVYVENVDLTVEKALKHGAVLQRPIKNEFFGDRVGLVVDPFGHKWHFATRQELVSPEEMQIRWKKMLSDF